MLLVAAMFAFVGCRMGTNAGTRDASASDAAETPGDAAPTRCADSQACPPDHVCVDHGTSGVECACPSGFRGVHCEIDWNACAPGLCMNGGSCKPLDVGITQCVCPCGQSGAQCEVIIDSGPCIQLQCLNGGTPIQGALGYVCECPTGFTGTYCEQPFDPCASVSCQNGGSCVAGYCSCPTGTLGGRCEIGPANCALACQNGGICVDAGSGPACICPPGYGGTLCATNLDDCAPNPCLNGATCVDRVADYSCNCPAGFTGKQCEIDLQPCRSPLCAWYGGECLPDGQGSVHCACDPGFTGPGCATNVDDCPATNPCWNGGVCVDLVGGFTCACAPGFGGTDCRTVLP